MKMVELHLFIPFQQAWTIQGVGPEHAHYKETGRVNYVAEQMMRLLMPF